MTKQAIIHVENTQGVIEFADFLRASGWKIISANKTEQLLLKNKIPVVHEAALEQSNFSVHDTSLLIRRVLLTKENADADMSALSETENNIYILCVNIFPFLDTTQQKISNETTKPENFYISTLLRNAFCNYENLLILTDPSDYKEAMIQIRTDNISNDFRMYLAAKALNLVAAFDGGVASSILQSAPHNVRFMKYLTFPFKKDMDLQQGTNQHQKACLYRTPVDFGALNGFSKLTGKDLNYTMAADSTFAWDQITSLYSLLKNQYIVKSENKDGYPYTTQFTPLTGTVFSIAVKMGNILGASLGSNVLESFRKTYSYANQNISNATFGCSAVIDMAAAKEISKASFSVIIAPSFTTEAKEFLSENKNIKLIAAGKSNDISVDGKLINGGIVLQERDKVPFKHWKVKTNNRPSQFIADEMALGSRMVMGARSYSAVLIKENAVAGISQSEVSVEDSLERVLQDAKRRGNLKNQEENTEGKDTEPLADVLVCDTAVPFCEQIVNLIDSGLSAILQTGGTTSDNDFIQYCNDHNVVMVFTDMTHINF